MDENKNVSQDVSTTENDTPIETTTDDLRAKVITDYGLSEDDNAELIEKLVTDKQAEQERFNSAVKQKINYRTKLEEATKSGTATDEKAKPATLDAEALRKETEALVRATLDEEYLASTDYSDEIKAEIKNLAANKGIGVRAAENDGYIQYLKDEAAKEDRVNQAASNGAKRGAGAVADTSQPLNPADFDFSTEEGRKAWDDAKAARRG